MKKYNLTLLIALTFIAQATETLGSGWKDGHFDYLRGDPLVAGTALGEEREAAPAPAAPAVCAGAGRDEDEVEEETGYGAYDSITSFLAKTLDQCATLAGPCSR